MVTVLSQSILLLFVLTLGGVILNAVALFTKLVPLLFPMAISARRFFQVFVPAQFAWSRGRPPDRDTFADDADDGAALCVVSGLNALVVVDAGFKDDLLHLFDDVLAANAGLLSDVNTLVASCACSQAHLHPSQGFARARRWLEPQGCSTFGSLPGSS